MKFVLCIFNLFQIGGRLLFTVGVVNELTEGENMIKKTLHDGSAVAKFSAMMKAQGVEPTVADRLCQKGTDLFKFLSKSKHVTEIKSKHTGTFLFIVITNNIMKSIYKLICQQYDNIVRM